MHDTTCIGLHNWSRNMFEKLGWIVLAHDEGDKAHVKNYISNIEYLVKHIDIKINKLKKLLGKEKDIVMIDKIDDLEQLKNNVLALHKYAKKCFK